MSIRLVGELLTPISCPMAGVTIHLKALDTSASVLFSSEASVKTDYKGRYEFTVPTGLYLVSLDNGISSAELGQIQVYSDSAESTLQALLDAPQTEPSPVWLQQLEEKLAEATRQAGLAAQSASEAANTAKSVTETADAAKQHADRAYASSTSASQSKLDAEDAATRAELAAKSSETNANSASDSASEARVSSDQSASNASSASQSAIDAEASAARVEEAAKSSEANAANAATSASNAAKSESNSASSEASAADSARIAEEAAIEAMHNANQAYNRGGVFKITTSQEYPDVSEITRDTLWIIQINPDSDPNATYTFKSGTLVGKTVRQGWQLIYDTPSNDWYIVPTGVSSVVSVNGTHGEVVLDAVDVGAVATTDAWKRSRKSVGVIDYDTLIEAGRYIGNGINSGSTNAPMGDITFVDVSTVGGWVYQTAYSYYSKKSQFFRMFRAGTDVGVPWEDYYTTANKPTPADIGACVAFSASMHMGGSSGAWSTADFVAFCKQYGALRGPYWVARGAWAFAYNKTIKDTGCGDIHLSGCVVEFIGHESHYTVRVTTPNTSHDGSVGNSIFTYSNNGAEYGPQWNRVTLGRSFASDISVDVGRDGAAESLLDVITELRSEIAKLKTKIK